VSASCRLYWKTLFRKEESTFLRMNEWFLERILALWFKLSVVRLKFSHTHGFETDECCSSMHSCHTTAFLVASRYCCQPDRLVFTVSLLSHASRARVEVADTTIHCSRPTKTIPCSPLSPVRRQLQSSGVTAAIQGWLGWP
jgi:hypothetical protein